MLPSIVSHAAGVSPTVIIVVIAAFVFVRVISLCLAYRLMKQALNKLGDADAANRAAIIGALATMWRKSRDKR